MRFWISLILVILVSLIFMPTQDTMGIVIGYNESELMLRYKVLGGYQIAVIPNTNRTLKLGDQILLKSRLSLLDSLMLRQLGKGAPSCRKEMLFGYPGLLLPHK